MRSQLCLFISGHSRVLVNARGNIHRFRAIVPPHDKRGETWMSLITCGSIHEGHEWFSNDSRGTQEIFVFGCEQFCQFANGDAKK